MVTNIYTKVIGGVLRLVYWQFANISRTCLTPWGFI